MLIFAETVMAVSATAVAVTVTVVPEGMVAGAVYVTAPASSLEPKVPQAAGLPQVTVQVTALLPLALAPYTAAAESVTRAFTASEVGTGEMNTTLVGNDGGAAPCSPSEPPQPANIALNDKSANMRCVMVRL